MILLSFIIIFRNKRPIKILNYLYNITTIFFYQENLQKILRVATKLLKQIPSLRRAPYQVKGARKQKIFKKEKKTAFAISFPLVFLLCWCNIT